MSTLNMEESDASFGCRHAKSWDFPTLTLRWSFGNEKKLKIFVDQAVLDLDEGIDLGKVLCFLRLGNKPSN